MGWHKNGAGKRNLKKYVRFLGGLKSSETLNKAIRSQLPTETPLPHQHHLSCCQNYKLGHVGKN